MDSIRVSEAPDPSSILGEATKPLKALRDEGLFYSGHPTHDCNGSLMNCILCAY